MSLPEFVYSLDGEWFEEFDVIQDQVNDDNEPGDKVSGYKGKSVPITHYDYIKELNIIELIQELAYDEDGDSAENYLQDMTDDMESGLTDAITGYFNDNCKQPNYYRVEDIVDHIFISDEYDE